MFNYHKSLRAELLKMCVMPGALNHSRVLVKNADYWAQVQTNCFSFSSLEADPKTRIQLEEVGKLIWLMVPKTLVGESEEVRQEKERQPIKDALLHQLPLWTTGA